MRGQQKGEGNTNAKLTEETVRDIREEYSKGLTSQINLAYSYNLEPSHVGKILRRIIWTHV